MLIKFLETNALRQLLYFCVLSGKNTKKYLSLLNSSTVLIQVKALTRAYFLFLQINWDFLMAHFYVNPFRL